jgi:hypothetical protein
MTSTRLPFPSDEFMQFLNDRPDAGKYFALGPRVIVVLDNLAYETIPGEAGRVPERLDPATAGLKPAPTVALGPTPVPDSVPESGEATLTLVADVTTGPVPLEVNFTGRVVGGPDNNPDLYCQAVTFDFGTGLSRSSTPQCAAWHEAVQIQREFSANNVFDRPGEYRVTFKLGDTQTGPVTIIVDNDSETTAFTDQSDQDGQTSPTVAPISGNSAPETGTGSSSCLTGLVIVPLLGMAITGFRRRTR